MKNLFRCCALLRVVKKMHLLEVGAECIMLDGIVLGNLVGI